jgi:ribosome biogenesis GTPase A
MRRSTAGSFRFSAGEGGGGKKGELPGHIRKAFRSIERFVPVVDIIIELLDARMPLSGRINGLTARLGKTPLVVLGKADLADPVKTKAWENWFMNQGIACISFNCHSAGSCKRILAKVQDMVLESDSRIGRSVRRAMIIGIPNVGKSTLINTLAGRKAARVANIPGVTRSIQWIKLTGKLELLDLPGILDFSLLRKGNLLRLINTIPGPNEDPLELVGQLFTLLREKNLLTSLPGLAGAEKGVTSFLESYGRAKNFVVRGGDPDIRRAALDVIKRFQDGLFGSVTLEMPEGFAIES